jgi:hypothetical protein
MRILAFCTIAALGGALALNAAESAVSAQAQAQAQDDAAAGIIAAQIRRQGFTCDKPKKAENKGLAAGSDLRIWVLDCGNASYRVQLVPNMAAKVEKLD